MTVGGSCALRQKRGDPLRQPWCVRAAFLAGFVEGMRLLVGSEGVLMRQLLVGNRQRGVGRIAAACLSPRVRIVVTLC